MRADLKNIMVNENQLRDARDAGERLLSSHPSEDPFAAAFKATRMPMLITDPRQRDNPIIFSNRAFSQLTGYSQFELVGQNCRLLQGPDTDRKAVKRIRHAVAQERDIAVDVLNYRKDGSTFWNALFVSPVRNQEGAVIYFFASQLDFTSIKNKEADLDRARQDAEQEVASRTAQLRDALSTKTSLVHEVDHRVKNNLLTIATIIKLQLRMTTDSTVKRTLKSVLNRVEALNTVQRKLLNDERFSKFNVADFGQELVTNIVEALKRPDILLTTDLNSVIVPAAKATPLALILNELVGDAFRRGLDENGGQIHLETRRFNGHFLIRVTDTLSPIQPDREDEAFSRAMVDASIRQLDAKIERHVDGNQTEVLVTLAED